VNPSAHCSDDAIDEYCLGRLEGQLLSEFEDHLLVCEICQDRLNKNLDFIMQLREAVGLPEPEQDLESTSGRRRHLRKPITQLVGIKYESAAKTGILEDISASGAGVYVSEPITPGTSVRLVLRDVSVNGAVRYCTPHRRAYRIGVDFLAA
jgi:hypothetical protein